MVWVNLLNNYAKQETHYKKTSLLLTASGLFLYTKLGPVSGTKFFPNWLKKFPIDQEHSQSAEKSQFKRYLNFPNFAKICTIYSQNRHIFSQNHTIFSQFHRYQKFPQKARKRPVHRINTLLLLILFCSLFDLTHSPLYKSGPRITMLP